jgi:hypothetical protein
MGCEPSVEASGARSVSLPLNLCRFLLGSSAMSVNWSSIADLMSSTYQPQISRKR